MRKSIVIVSVLIGMFVFSGCSTVITEDDDSVRNDRNQLITLFLMDQDGYSAGGVPYSCIDENDRYVGTFETKPNGEFSFYVGERCTFDLEGYDGTPDDPLYIEDDRGIGKEDIPYECEYGDGGTTDRNGRFEYLQDDSCKFYF